MDNSVDESTSINFLRIGVSSRTHCLSCGTDKIKPGRRYCSPECRKQITWVLSLSKGLLFAFNTRYAAFSFTSELVILDIMPSWSMGISRFVKDRDSGEKPAIALKKLILASGEEWHQLVGSKSRSYASLLMLDKNYNKDISPDSIKPNGERKPRLSKHEDISLKTLCLTKDDLVSDCSVDKIKSAYRALAKQHHPDMGGDAEKFKRLNNAHKQMLMWVENPSYTAKKALQDCWSYNGSTNRWSPPL